MQKKTVKKTETKVTQFQGMITVSPLMLKFFEQLRKVAKTDASILMRGETGTGKELAARAIHSLSQRSHSAFHAINCATLSSEMMQSELFGHIKGSFTGATADRKGLFELADLGTLFLDEIAEIPLDVQARLLRVLQDNSFTPLGSTIVRKVNVRLVSATHESLREAVAEKKFREDLMYRIRVIPLFLPRLADRDGDVEMLTWRFIEEFAALGYRRIEMIDADVLDALLNHDWPGNIRELRNVVEFACALGDGNRLKIEDLTPELRGEKPTHIKSPSLADMEKKKILNTLAKTHGHRGEAAKLLGMSRGTLWRKIREYGIQ